MEEERKTIEESQEEVKQEVVEPKAVVEQPVVQEVAESKAVVEQPVKQEVVEPKETVVEEPIKPEKKGRSTKSKIITVMLGVSLFCVFVLLGWIIFFDKEDEGPPKKPEQQEEKQETKTINYELRGEELYINNNKFALDGAVLNASRIFKLSDLLIVGDCRSVCDWYFVDSDAKIVGTIGNNDNSTIQYNQLVVPKFSNVEVEKVEGNDIYFYDYGFNYQDGSSLCGIDDTEVVYVNEKVSYLGNSKFGEKTTISSKTRSQIMQEDQRFSCENS